MDAVKKWDIVPNYWKRKPNDILERWAIHEEWVLQAKSMDGHAIHTLRLEDLCQNPVKVFEELCSFLKIKLNADLVSRVSHMVKPDPNVKYETFKLQYSPRARSIMEIYGYDG
jgi:hypothetical protein